ncbi:MAG: dihydroorotase [Kiritimatiellia bacterium]
MELPLIDDLHVHLRQGQMLRDVVPLTRAGGVGRCVVMPNTDPPVTTIEAVHAYRRELEACGTGIDFLMMLYLTPALRPADLAAARAAGVLGIKYYPHGVTTNSHWGVADLRQYDALFAAMETAGVALLMHGEVPSQPEADICILNAEERFLPELERIHKQFPRLRMVLEHVTTRDAVQCIKGLGATVGATITAHHLDLTVDDWAGRNHNFCKPVAKYPHDREALRQVVAAGHPRFFLGSDSAPHPRSAKESACGCAGVFTAPLLLPYLADTFERIGCLDRLRAFCCEFGYLFYGLPAPSGRLVLEKAEQIVPHDYNGVVPFRAGERLGWQIMTS